MYGRATAPPVVRVIRRLGPGEVEAEIGLPWPQPFSLAEEWLDEVPPRAWPDGRAAGANRTAICPELPR